MAKRKTKSKTIAQRISELEDMVANFFTGAAKTTKASAKRAKTGGKKRVAKAKRAIKRTAKTARRKVNAIV